MTGKRARLLKKSAVSREAGMLDEGWAGYVVLGTAIICPLGGHPSAGEQNKVLGGGSHGEFFGGTTQASQLEPSQPHVALELTKKALNPLP